MQCVAGGRVGAGQQRAKAGRGGEQHRGLALDHPQVGGLVGVRVAHVQQLQHLALGDGVGGVGQDPLHVHALEFDHQLEAARVQEVADQHRGGIAPDRVRGLAAAAQVGFVDHVVVQQGGGVDELDHRRQLVGVCTMVAKRAGGEQQQHRPQPLAAGTDDVFGHLVDQHHVRRQPPADQGIHRRHVGCGQGLDRGQVELPLLRNREIWHGKGLRWTRDYRPWAAPGRDAANSDATAGRSPVAKARRL